MVCTIALHAHGNKTSPIAGGCFGFGHFESLNGSFRIDTISSRGPGTFGLSHGEACASHARHAHGIPTSLSPCSDRRFPQRPDTFVPLRPWELIPREDALLRDP